MNIYINNARIIDPATAMDIKGDLYIKDGVIRGIYERAHGNSDPDFKKIAAEDTVIIDGTGLIASPGFIDVHSHFRDPGLTYKEDIITGASAAAAGGYTTVVCMANTKPVVDNEEVLDDLIKRESALPVNVLQDASVTIGLEGRELTDMETLKKHGAAGFTDDGVPVCDKELLREALLKCRELDVPISLHEEDPALLGSPGVNRGRVSDALSLKGAPSEAEYKLVMRDLHINRSIGAKLDIQHVSAKETVEALRTAKAEGIRVFSEVTPQHLSSTEDLVLKKGSLARVNPPLRTEADRQALIAGLRDGTIDIVATDHAPHSKEEKSRPVETAPSGMTGLETALGLLLTNLYATGELSLSRILYCLTKAPADLYGLDAGRIRLGGTADVVLFDPDRKWIVPDEFYSKASNTPYIGDELKGRVIYTICRGKIVYSCK
jgi:dihydroorotase